MFGNARMSTGRRSRKALPSRTHEALHGEGDLVARCELVHEPLALLAHQQRAVAANSLGDEEAVEVSGHRHGGRVELHELQVCERSPGVVGERQAGADRSAWVRRPLP